MPVSEPRFGWMNKNKSIKFVQRGIKMNGTCSTKKHSWKGKISFCTQCLYPPWNYYCDWIFLTPIPCVYGWLGFTTNSKLNAGMCSILTLRNIPHKNLETEVLFFHKERPGFPSGVLWWKLRPHWQLAVLTLVELIVDDDICAINVGYIIMRTLPRYFADNCLC